MRSSLPSQRFTNQTAISSIILSQDQREKKHTHTKLLTFIIEAINSINAGTFMVSSEEEKILWVFYLVGQ